MTPLAFSAEVEAARERSAPIVALESTILAHGMPYPANLETACELERIVREAGAVPATIAVLAGTIRIGLDAAQLQRVAHEPMLKAGRADLAYAIARGTDAATTVAATVACAALAGIEVFATGGIGGVHRGAQQSMDVSGDLDAIAKNPVAVVCSGAKAILDLPATLEALETRGVTVVGFRTDEFPAFWSRTSGLRLMHRADSAGEIAALVRARRALDDGGIVVANPIDAADEIPRAEMEGYVETAIGHAMAAGIGGAALTPWLLERILTLTSGRSLRTNIALVKSNARLAALAALALTAS
ncbi:MAG: pseudouridine-5'-phosphate glycosidase [Candidatus Tyrphobacter sp.]